MPDASFQLFYILKNNGLAIQIQRFGAAMTQVFPYLSSLWGCDLDTVAKAYSLSFPIIYIILGGIILLFYGNTRIGIVYFLFHFLINTHSFFWMQCELIQAVSLFMVWIAFLEHHLQKNSHNFLFWIVNVSFIITLVYFYPLLILLLGYTFLFLFSDALFRRNGPMMWSAGLYVCIFGIKNIFFKNYYDSGSMSQLKNVIELFPNYLSQHSFHQFGQLIIHDYYGFIILFLVVVHRYYRDRKWAYLSLFLVFFLGILFLINICFAHGAEPFYLEGQYALLAIVLGFPLAYHILPNWNFRFILFFLCSILILFLYRIVHVQPIYHERVDMYNHLIDSYRGQKVLIHEHEGHRQKLKMTWGSSYEVWLLSTLEEKTSSSIMIHNNPSSFDWAMHDHHSFFTCWEVIPYRDLNPRYFVFRDTSAYQKF